MSQTDAFVRVVALSMARYGENFTLNPAGPATSRRGLFTPMDSSTVNLYFDANESVGLIRPALSLYLAGSDPDPPQVNSNFFRDGRLWTVRKTQFFRLDNVVLVTLSLCD